MHEILLVEDCDSDAELIKLALRNGGITNPVVRVSDGAAAMRYLRAVEEAFESSGPPVPSILLLDLKLPDMSGFEILQALQLRQAFSKTLRLVLSQYGDTENIKRAYALGAHSFLSKPIREDELQELVKTYSDYCLVG